jgi:predicted RNA methylase
MSSHAIMLKDVTRTKAYQNAFERMKPEFQDKIVLDIGAGTGILSIMAAKIGAKHVYAIEPTEMCHKAQQIIDENEVSDKITII